MTCRYHKLCKYFQPDHPTCQSYDAEDGYCGVYRSFERLAGDGKVDDGLITRIKKRFRRSPGDTSDQ